MVTAEMNGTGRQILTFYGLDKDEKPQGNWKLAQIENGSKFFVMDKSEVYMYDEENHSWLLQE